MGVEPDAGLDEENCSLLVLLLLLSAPMSDDCDVLEDALLALWEETSMTFSLRRLSSAHTLTKAIQVTYWGLF